jgi:hypothetical protein
MRCRTAFELAAGLLASSPRRWAAQDKKVNPVVQCQLSPQFYPSGSAAVGSTTPVSQQVQPLLSLGTTSCFIEFPKAFAKG